MTAADVAGTIETAAAAFRALEGGEDEPPTSPERLAVFRRRHVHLLRTDPDGQWVAADGQDRVVGAACALRRAGLWGLSLLAVRPGHQSAGLGRRLLDLALQTAEGATGGLILSSHDPRAIRRYALAGFALHPTLRAAGVVRRAALTWPPGVREGAAADLPATVQADVAVRGVPHGDDLPVMLEDGGRLLVAADGGYVTLRESRVVVLAATAAAVAADLLTAALLVLPAGEEVSVSFVTGAQQWAFPVLLSAGLALRPAGPVCVRGDVGPLTPYLPSGMFL